MSVDDTDAMGFNPQRKRIPRTSDYVFVGAAVVACLVLVLWTMLG